VGNTFSITGVNETIAGFKSLGDNAERVAASVVSANADNIVLEAKQSAPADLGGIRQGIIKEQLAPTLFAIAATAPESAYQEFGTGGKVDIPAEMADIASEFQGAGGGSFQDFILALTEWVRRHGGGYGSSYSIATHRRVGNRASNANIDEQAAYAIARSILKNGLKPQPYLYPAFVTKSPDLLPALQDAFTKLTL
jgi:hypothetical protein